MSLSLLSCSVLLRSGGVLTLRFIVEVISSAVHRRGGWTGGGRSQARQVARRRGGARQQANLGGSGAVRLQGARERPCTANQARGGGAAPGQRPPGPQAAQKQQAGAAGLSKGCRGRREGGAAGCYDGLAYPACVGCDRAQGHWRKSRKDLGKAGSQRRARVNAEEAPRCPSQDLIALLAEPLPRPSLIGSWGA